MKKFIERKIRYLRESYYDRYKEEFETLNNNEIIALKLELETNVEFKSFWFSFSMISSFLLFIWYDYTVLFKYMGVVYSKQIAEMTNEMRGQMVEYSWKTSLVILFITFFIILFLRNKKKTNLRKLKCLNHYLATERDIENEATSK